MDIFRNQLWQRLVVLMLAFGLGSSCGMSRQTPADLALVNGRIVTVDDKMPEAQAVAISKGRIVAIGDRSDIEPYLGKETEVIDLEGRLAIPGFIEGHGHFSSLGRAKMILDLTSAQSWEAIVDMVAEAADKAKPGEWILGHGWHQEKWQTVPSPIVEGLPLHDSLSAVSPDNPVLLGHASGHGSFANAKALELGGIKRDTKDPAGGTIVRDAKGNATGALREKAQLLVRQAYQGYEESRGAEARRADMELAVKLAGEEALAKGVTSFHDAGASFETIKFYQELGKKKILPIRLYVMVRFETNEAMAERLPDYRLIGAEDGYLTVRSIKRQIDGALGAHGAWLLEPYTDLPESSGLVLETPEDIARTAEIAIQHGFQVNTHAIGDRANREVLDLYENSFKSAGVAGSDLRWRIEHAQHVHPDDLPRFAEIGVIASMQGVHCTSDGPWVAKRIGEDRARSTSYRWRDFFDAGVVVTNGTDVPVEAIDPLASFYASVTRKSGAESVFYPEQRMSREEALKSYTLNGAYSAFEEQDKGSLSVGKYGDIVVLSKDIMTIPDDDILETEVIYTIVGGEVKYKM